MSAVAKTCAVLALAGSAAAYAPTMSLSANRRGVVQGAAAAAVAAPLLRPNAAGAEGDFASRAPGITIMDHRGCSRKGSEYRGQRSGDQDDEMCVVVKNVEVGVSLETAQKKLQEFISYQAKAIDGEFTAQGPKPGQPAFYCEVEGCK